MIYQISNYNELGKDKKMFTPNTGTPQLVIIGQNSKLTFSHYGYITEDTLRVEIRKALNEFGDLQQIKKISNTFLQNERIVIDLSTNFISVNSELITNEVLSVQDSSIAEVDLTGSDLSISKGINTGITQIKVSASTSTETVIDSFKVMSYPVSANVIDFESGVLVDPWHHEGDADWFIDKSNSAYGSQSARSGLIDNADSLNGSTNSMLWAEFESTKDDTLAFAYKISSEINSDGLNVFIDDGHMTLPDRKWCGEIDWRFVEYPVKAGKHSIEWDYFKWGVLSAGNDAALIDIVRIPGELTGIGYSGVPVTTQLKGNYPNPFNPVTTIYFSVKEQGRVELVVYDILGREVTKLVDGELNQGYHSASFDASQLSSGIYYYRLKTANIDQSRKMVFIK